MCDTCGCNVTSGNEHLIRPGGKLAHAGDGTTAITILHGLLDENDRTAAHNRQHLDQKQILAINLMSSPGSGKTTLLEATIDALGDEYRIAVIEGDLETENDANRIRAHGVPAIQITTGNACHLDAHMVHNALHELDLSNLDIVFIENVGNLVCPASFDLGQHLNITLLSVPEGVDKPSKYPVMFRAADLLLLTKADLAPHFPEFDEGHIARQMKELANAIPQHSLTTRAPETLGAWTSWLREQVDRHRERCLAGESLRPAIQPDGARLHATKTPA